MKSFAAALLLAALSAGLSGCHQSSGAQAPAEPSQTGKLSGTWSGGFGVVGGDGVTPQFIIFHQDGAHITGSGGPDAKEQYPIVSGGVTGEIVRLEIRTDKRAFFYYMKHDGDKLRGDILIREPDNTKSSGKVWLERSH